jgi:hypothetical protein
MMTKDIIQSERQRPRAVEIMKDIYVSHVQDPTCGLGETCPMMVNLKKRIEAEEALLAGESARVFGLK